MGKMILVVDDEQEIRETTRSILLKRGYEVLTASNGAVALDVIKEHRPDLIMADVLMPEMNGYAFYKELKSHPLTANIPVLIVTGRGKMEDSFKVVGVDGFIAKPFSPKILISEIDHILSNSPDGPILKDTNKSIFKLLAIGISNIVLNSMVQEAEKKGYEMVTVNTGADAISKSVLFAPNIILMDVSLHDMTPADLVKILRRLPNIEDVPIIGFCYYDSKELDEASHREEILQIHEKSKLFLDAGATEYIGRYHHENFLDSIKKYIKT